MHLRSETTLRVACEQIHQAFPAEMLDLAPQVGWCHHQIRKEIACPKPAHSGANSNSIGVTPIGQSTVGDALVIVGFQVPMTIKEFAFDLGIAKWMHH